MKKLIWVTLEKKVYINICMLDDPKLATGDEYDAFQLAPHRHIFAPSSN